MSNWLDKQVSLYSAVYDNVGRPATFREILLSEFWKDLDALIDIRALDRQDLDYKKKKTELKLNLQCYTPAGLLACKEKKNVIEIERSGIMQLDFDVEQNQDYDVEELKQCVFNLPFIAFCGLSASGDGFYALALIAEPERLSEYAEHCFTVFEAYDIKPDHSKGKKVENLRYLSYDSKMLIRDNPEVLRIKQFQTNPAPKKKFTVYSTSPLGSNKTIVTNQLNEIKNAQVGQRWPTIQKAAYTLGGTGDRDLINLIIAEINANPAFNGEEEKYEDCAVYCFNEGLSNPLPKPNNFIRNKSNKNA